MSLALIAGQGALPARLIAACGAAGRPVTVCGVRGYDGDLPVNDKPFRLETIGTLIADLKTEGVREVCFCGAVQRPEIDPAAVDAATRPILERLAGALTAAGDDAALRILLSVFEEAGFLVQGAHEIAPDLLPREGVPSRRKPSDAHGADAGRGVQVVAAMAAADLGQACVIRARQVIALEALPGTDWMLRSLVDVPTGLTGPFASGGILYKAPKPGQDRRVDLPAIGPETIKAASAVGLEGVVIEADGVMVLDLPATIAAADAEGLFLWVRRAAPREE
ncbi:MAG: UDP-2,3-diacylglucosamine diphosphatase LpxI [Pseudomonadota bacterium]